MTRYVLLDTNLLIGAFDPQPDNEAHAQSRQKVKDLMHRVHDGEIKLAITPLIRYEVLRKVQSVSLEDMKTILDDFDEFNIGATEANRAAELYSAMHATDKLNKHAFDVFHYVASEVNDLELLSNDGDIPKIKRYIASTSIATQIQT